MSISCKVDDATKALEATSGTTLEKNGQILRVAYAKSIVGPGSGATQSSSLAAAAIEAATFAQQVIFVLPESKILMSRVTHIVICNYWCVVSN